MDVNYEVIVKPIITEKSSNEMALGKYIFMVKREANKITIKKAVEAIYKVKVKNVNTINYKGKKRNWGKVQGKRSDWKKAIIMLQPGQKIETISA